MVERDNAILLENIRNILNEKGIKHCKVAGKLGMSNAEFSRMLAGKRVVRACYSPSIADALGCDCNDLFRGAGAA